MHSIFQFQQKNKFGIVNLTKKNQCRSLELFNIISAFKLANCELYASIKKKIFHR